MKSIRFLCPYFGKLPKTVFPFWLQSCSYNPSIEWYIFTDDSEVENFDLPSNVKILPISLDELSTLISEKISLKVKLTDGYKLCDFKPLYGVIFQDWLSDIDFWGHCDISDTLYGNLRLFLTEQLLSKAEKIMFLGHMTIYRNTSEINERFRLKTKSRTSLEDIFCVAENKAFDELTPYSINRIYMENGLEITRLDDMYVDITPLYFRFRSSSYDSKFNHEGYDSISRIFQWDSGRLFEISIKDCKAVKREVGYIHFQKRHIKNRNVELGEKFYITPKGLIGNNINDMIRFIRTSNRNILPYLPFFKLKYKAVQYKFKNQLDSFFNRR
ncbi:TPA: DUF6625 family protein [Streptococcus suis]